MASNAGIASEHAPNGVNAAVRGLGDATEIVRAELPHTRGSGVDETGHVRLAPGRLRPRRISIAPSARSLALTAPCV